MVTSDMVRLNYIISLFFLLFLFAGCMDSSKKHADRRAELTLESVDEILIGVNWFESAETSTFAHGLYMALDEVNLKGVRGKKIRVDYRCNSGDAKRNYKITRCFAKNNKMSAVFGHAYSNLAEISLPIYQRSGLFVFNINAELASLSLYGFNLQYRLSVSTGQVASYLANILLEKNLKKPIIINTKSDYSQDLTRRFINQLDNMGSRPTDIYTIYDTKKPDSKFFIRILYRDFDSIFMITEPEMVLSTLKVVRGLKLNQPAFSTVINESLINSDPGVIGELYMVNTFNPSDDNPLTVDFVQKYRNRYNHLPDQFAALGYASMRLYADMVDSAGSISPVSIAEQCAILKCYNSIIGAVEFMKSGDIENRVLYLQKAGAERIDRYSDQENWLQRFRESLLRLLSDSFVDEMLKVTIIDDSTIAIEISAYDIFIEGTTSLTTHGGDLLSRLSASVKSELSCFKTSITINNLYNLNPLTQGILSQSESHAQWALDRANTIASAFTQSGYNYEQVNVKATLTNHVPADKEKTLEDIILIELQLGDHDPDCNKNGHKEIQLGSSSAASGVNP